MSSDATDKPQALLSWSSGKDSAFALRYRRDITYARDHYLQLVASYSGFQTMSADAQQTITQRIAALIDDAYGGSVVRPAVATLCLARPLTSPPHE